MSNQEVNSKQQALFIIRAMAVIIIVTFIFLTIGAKNEESWPHVIGRIVTSDSYLDSGYRRSPKWMARLGYEYYVNGKKYTGVTQFVKKDKLEAVQAVNKCPIDSRSPVYYSPNNYGNSTLEPGYKFSNYAYGILFGFVLFLISPGLAMISQDKKK